MNVITSFVVKFSFSMERNIMVQSTAKCHAQGHPIPGVAIRAD
jgi:hypothetical protein